jgi:hypothetical protein
MTRIERPDGSSYNPSLGHTANAFASAEFLWQEYKDVIWYGISGYIIASGTGVLRIYNNRHWLTDVAAGAGIEFYVPKLRIVSKMQNYFFKKNKQLYIAPFYNGQQTGLISKPL